MADTDQLRKSPRLKPSTGPADTGMIHGPLPQSPPPKVRREPESLTRTVPVVTRSGWRPKPPKMKMRAGLGSTTQAGTVAQPQPSDLNAATGSTIQAGTVAPSEPTQAASGPPLAQPQPPSDALPPLTQAGTAAPPVATQAATVAPSEPTQAASGPPLAQPQPPSDALPPLTQAGTAAPPVATQAATVAPSEPTQAASGPPLAQPQPPSDALPPLTQAGTAAPPVANQAATGAEMQPLKKLKRKTPPRYRQVPLRRSKRLNPEKLAPTPQQCPKSAPKAPISAPLSSQNSPESVSSVKTFRGPNPTNPNFKPKKSLLRPEGSTPLSSESSDQGCPGNGGNPEVSVEMVGDQVGVEDDGSRRVRLRLPLSYCIEARGLSGKELDPLEQKELFGKKRKSKGKGKGKKDEKPRGRGLAKAREPARPEGRPELYVVGDAEFRSSTKCTKVVSTIRLLTLTEMPGPYRTYSRFPSRARIEILRRFLQRYSWGPGQDEGRCLEVFEKIAAEAYTRVLNKARKACDNKYGPVKELWKQDCPLWCKDESNWRALCDIWSNENWEKESYQNHKNKKDNGPKINHVGGSRSAYKHKEAMEAEMGTDFGMKALFDRLHTKDGTVYVNERAQRVVSKYNTLKELHQRELPDEKLWEMDAEGEDRRGRVFGFGNKARICRANREFQAMEASQTEPTRSTATSAEGATKTFTEAQVAELLSETIAAERRVFANDAAAQEERHKAEMAAVRKQNEWSATCIAALYNKLGAKPPKFGEGSSNNETGSGDNGGGDNA